MSPETFTPAALVTGGSSGLGLALVRALSDDGWSVVTDGRREGLLQSTAELLPGVTAVAGDVTDPEHRAALVGAVRRLGRLDLLVHNASSLGPLPLRPLVDLTPGQLAAVWSANAGAPHALTRRLVPQLLASDGVVLSISSDAAVNAYEGWGAYGSAKAALDHLTLTLGAETGLRTYAVDPGDMATAMHQDAVPEDDLTQLTPPEAVVPLLLALLRDRPPTGRYLGSQLAAPAGASA